MFVVIDPGSLDIGVLFQVTPMAPGPMEQFAHPQHLRPQLVNSLSLCFSSWPLTGVVSDISMASK